MILSYDMSSFTAFVRWGNGPGDPLGYSKSLIKGMWTTQQFAAALGVNQGAARDIMSGRHNGHERLGVKIKDVWFINCDIGYEEVKRRNK